VQKLFDEPYTTWMWEKNSFGFTPLAVERSRGSCSFLCSVIVGGGRRAGSPGENSQNCVHSSECSVRLMTASDFSFTAVLLDLPYHHLVE